MKKILLITTMLALQVNLFGQAIPNGTFESWNSIPYNGLDGWTSGNKESIPQMGITCVTKVAGFTGFAARMQTSIAGADTTYAYIAMGDPKGDGGTPYSQMPTAITGYYRYNLSGNDTALLMVMFKQGGSPISFDLFKIKGTGNQSTFAFFSFPLNLSVVPDSVIVAAAASNLMSGVGVQHGSFLELDKLMFTGPGITQQIPNNEFENWTALNYDMPDNWVTWGEGVTKTAGSYAGSYAVRLETMDSGGGNINSSGITTGYMTNNSGPAGGIPYTLTKDTLCGYYKYTSMGNGNANIYVSLTNNGSSVGGNNKLLTTAVNYTYFEIPFQGSTPDTIRIDVESSQWPVSSANVGSVLYLDNLYLKSSPLGIFENVKLKSKFYPNPVKDVLSVQFENKNSGSMELYLYDALGRHVEVNSVSRNINSMRIDIANLFPGIYFYEIRTVEGSMRNKFIKE